MLYEPGYFRILDATGALVAEGTFTSIDDALRSLQAENYKSRVDGQLNDTYHVYKKDEIGAINFIMPLFNFK